MRTVIKQTELPFMAAAKTKLSALDQLKKAANLKSTKREVQLKDGSIFEFYTTPLTMAERERAQAAIKNKDDMNAMGLRLFIQKALDENGRRRFSAGQYDELRNDVDDATLQKLILAVIGGDDEIEEEELDPKD